MTTAPHRPAPGPDEAERQVLRARAARLARPADATRADEAGFDVLAFQLAGERYAVDASLVRAVHALRQLTPLPCTPAFVLGVVSVRGQLLTVVDLKKFFGLPDEGLTDLHRVLRVADGEMEFGVLADMELGLMRLRPESLQPPLSTLTGIGAEYVRGIAPDRLIVLDMAAILRDPRLLVDEQA